MYENIKRLIDSVFAKFKQEEKSGNRFLNGFLKSF